MHEPHERLDEALKNRVDELDMTWVELATTARIAVQTLSAIRAGRNRPNARTARRLEDALGWEHGSIAAILAGDSPTLDDDPVVDDRERLERLERTAAALLEEIRQLRRGDQGTAASDR